MKEVVCKLITSVLILSSSTLIIIGLTELITGLILKETPESGPYSEHETTTVPRQNLLSPSSAILGSVTFLVGLLVGLVMIVFLVKYTNTKKALEERLASIQEHLPSDWGHIKISRKESARITEEVENLFNDTWQYTERIGKDSVNLKHDGLKIRTVCVAHKQKHISEHQKNSERFKQQGLQQQKRRLMRLHSTKGQAEPLTWSSELGDEIYKIDNSLPGTCQEINEVYLFHGTKKQFVKDILNDGFSLAKSSDGLYGKALYFAESAEKSDQYTDRRNDRRAEGLCMLLVRVALGKIYIHDDTNTGESRLTALPCTETGCFTPGCDAHAQKYHSAVAGMGKRFREFLLYDSQQCYPHVLVFYDRINKEEREAISNSKKGDIPCYIVGPNDEIQHLKDRKLTNNVSPACSVVNETLELETKLESNNFDSLFGVIQSPTSESERETSQSFDV